ncbi:MAG: class I SAM-dependent methyltransferase [Chitinophagaceae bacterium]
MKTDNHHQPEFWEANFKAKKEMWGSEPSLSAILAKDFFLKQGVKEVLIPGFGYGRNARVFSDAGLKVTGIEISQTAIDLARKHYGSDVIIHHGSVTEMPFDDRQYDGIFCYALIHLLDGDERAKLIHDCYNQLKEGGYMIFTAISKTAEMYGKGKLLSKDRYELFAGLNMFFYDRDSIEDEFGEAGLVEVSEVEKSYPLFFVRCWKG